jgi:PAS domain S-box-containing protein
MIFKLTNISAIIFIAVILNVFTAGVSWRRRKIKGGMYFAIAMLALTFWTLAAGLDYAAVAIPLKVLFTKLEYLGYHSALALLAIYTLLYAGHEAWLKKTWVKVFFVFIPVSNILLDWTNELHGWLWTGFIANGSGNNVVIFEHGPGFIWTTLTGYLMIAIIATNLLQVAFMGPVMLRKQARLLLLALLIPVASNLLYQFDTFNIPGVDWTSITFSITGIVFLIAIYGSRFLEIIPIARNTLIERLPDGVLVLDSQGCLVDFNPQAQAIFGIRKEDLWIPIKETLARWPEVVALLTNPSEKAEQEISLDDPEKAFDLRLTPLTDQRSQVYGQLVVMRDISDRKRIEEVLRFSEDKFYKAFHSSPDAITITHLKNGRIVEVNDGFCRLTGYSRQEALATSMINLRFWADLADRKQVVKSLRQFGRVQNLEYQFRTKSGELLTGIYSGEIIPLGGEAHLISIIRDITQRKLAERQLLEAQTQLVEQQRELARVEERQRMARNLHDSLSQSLHSLVLFSETLDAMIQKNNIERARQIVRQVQESARQSHKETRLLLYELQDSGPGRSIDLIRDLEERLAKVERHTGVKAEFVQEGSLEDCPCEWRENLFWIAIEALNNALKHAQARSVKVMIRFSPERIELEVGDDGKGFDPAKIHNGGMGLNNMRSRTDLLGGTLTVEPSREGGTLVRLIIKKEAG